MTIQQIANVLAKVNRGLIQGRYDQAAAYVLLREELHKLLYHPHKELEDYIGQRDSIAQN